MSQSNSIPRMVGKAVKFRHERVRTLVFENPSDPVDMRCNILLRNVD